RGVRPERNRLHARDVGVPLGAGPLHVDQGRERRDPRRAPPAPVLPPGLVAERAHAPGAGSGRSRFAVVMAKRSLRRLALSTAFLVVLGIAALAGLQGWREHRTDSRFDRAAWVRPTYWCSHSPRERMADDVNK